MRKLQHERATHRGKEQEETLTVGTGDSMVSRRLHYLQAIPQWIAVSIPTWQLHSLDMLDLVHQLEKVAGNEEPPNS